jgi:hypothetical protein
MAAQWREIIKDKAYALYVYDHHRIAIAQFTDQGWVITLPDDPTKKHSAKDQKDAFKTGCRVAKAWLQGALKQLSIESTEPPRALTTTEAEAVVKKNRDRFKKNYSSI